MASIEERVLSMSFDNAKFEAGVAKTMATLTKLNQALQNAGSSTGLAGIQKAANQVDLSGLTSNIDKLKQNLASVSATDSFASIEGAANKVNFGPFTGVIENVKSRLSTLTDAPSIALDKFKEKLGFRGVEAGFNNIENASNKVKFAGASLAAADLEKKLAFPGVANSFSEIEKASGKVRLSGLTTAISEVSKAFSLLEGAAAVALGNIASKAVLAGGKLVKDLSFGPITAGMSEYATNLNSIQTILANTKFQGSTLKDVNAALAQLNKYSDQTIYNFSQMAKNIGTFTAAGVDLDTSVASIKGIANLAALSGSNSQQASTAMYQLSQAIASGRVSLQDWNSVVNAGMGGATFQRALAQTAQAMGTVADGAVKIDKATGKATINGQSFRESITAKPGEQSWLTSDVLTSTLQQFTGDLSKAELAAMGFNEAQIESIQATAITAKKAATEVKTLSGVFDVVKESIASGWAATFQNIFGNFEEAKTLFTGVTNVITEFIGTSADARNAILKDWKELGGRTSLIEGIKNVFQGLISVIEPIKDAFRDIFPKKTGEDLFAITKGFENFTEKLKIGPETADNLKRTFAGFFAILDVGKMIIKGVLSVFGDLLGAASSGSGGFLEFTGSVGDFLVSIRNAIKEGQGLTKFFDGLGAVLSAPIKLLGLLGDALGSLFEGGGDSKGVASSMSDMTGSLKPLTVALRAMESAWQGFLDILGDVGDALEPAIDEIGEIFGGFGDLVADALSGGNFDKVFQIIQTTLIGGIFLAIKKALGGGLNIDFGGGLLDKMGESMSALTGSLKAMQTNIKAGTLLKIAAAVGVLAAGVVALSTIDPARLTTAMTAISVGLGQLIAAMALLAKVGGATTFLTMPFIAGSLILLATAVDVLAIAVFAFSKLSWEELIKGLAGVAGSLVAIGLGIRMIPATALLIGPALLPIAVALNLMALAMKVFATMDWEELAKGLVGIAGGLTAIGLGTKLIGPSILIIGPGLIAVAVALNLLAFALRAFGSLDLVTMGKGLGGIAASLILIGIAIRTIPPTVALQAAGLILLSVALTGIAGAIGLMGSMNIKTIAKGLATIGASLVVLGVGLKFMSGTLLGAVALMAAASALAVLAPVLGILGTMKWSTIAKGLAAIALLLGTLAAAGLIAAPALTALGIALIPFAAGVALAGAGIYLIASGIAKLGSDAPKNIAAVMAAMTALVALLPTVVINFIKGLVDIAESIAALAPKIVESMVKIVEMLLDVVIRSAPKMGEAVIILMSEFLKVVVVMSPQIVSAGFKVLLDFLSGIANNIGKVVEQTSQIIVAFLTQLAVEMPRIIAAGANTLVEFLGGLASNFPKVLAAGAEAVAKFLQGIADNMNKVVTAAVNMIVAFVNAIANNVGKLIAAGAEVIVKFLKGIADNVDDVVKAAVNMIDKFFKAAVKAALDLIDAGARAVINFINGVASAIREHSDELGEAGANLGSAIVQGAISGMAAMGGKLISEALSLFAKIPGKVKKFLGIDSPSKVFMEIGKNVMEGMIVGIDANASGVISRLESTAGSMIDTMANSLSVVPDILDGLMDSEPVITPILDLSNVKRGAQELGELTNVVPITAAASYNQASSISTAQEEAQMSIAEASVTPAPEFRFEQNNYSPESLSTAEIYRQTRNQLSQAKSALGLVS